MKSGPFFPRKISFFWALGLGLTCLGPEFSWWSSRFFLSFVEVGHDLSLDFHHLRSLRSVCIFGSLEYSNSVRISVHTVPMKNVVVDASYSSHKVIFLCSKDRSCPTSSHTSNLRVMY